MEKRIIIDNEMRKEVKELSDEELDDELTIPTGNWKEDVQREVLRRILYSLKPRETKWKNITNLKNGNRNLSSATVRIG